MKLRVLRQLLAMNIMINLEYRAAMFLFMVDAIVNPLITLQIWLTVSAQGVQLPYSREQFVTYYVLLSFVSMITSTWLAPFTADKIRLGRLSPWLLRPAPYIFSDIANNIGEKVIKLPLLLPMVGLVALLYRDELRVTADPGLWLIFVLALFPAAAISFLIDFVIGSLAFWIDDVRGVNRVKNLANSFLAGRFVPLALFPPAFAGFLEAQPFRYIVSFPLEVLAGSLSQEALLRGFAWELFYLAALWALYRVMWHFGLRGYSAAGA